MVVSLSGVVNAAVTAQWTVNNIGGGYSRYTLSVYSNTPDKLLTFSIAVVGTEFVQDGDPWGATRDNDTHFLLEKAHDFPPVTDLLVVLEGVSDSYLYGAFTVAAGGQYDGGWQSLELLDIISTDPLYDLGVYDADMTVSGTFYVDKGCGQEFVQWLPPIYNPSRTS